MNPIIEALFKEFAFKDKELSDSGRRKQGVWVGNNVRAIIKAEEYHDTEEFCLYELYAQGNDPPQQILPVLKISVLKCLGTCPDVKVEIDLNRGYKMIDLSMRICVRTYALVREFSGSAA